MYFIYGKKCASAHCLTQHVYFTLNVSFYFFRLMYINGIKTSMLSAETIRLHYNGTG